MAKKEKTEKKVKEPKPKKEKSNEIGLFDIINYIFCNPKKLREVPKVLLDRNFFMINRILGIGFPMQAQAFQIGKTNNVETIYCWSDFLISKGYHRVPGFVFTKGVQRTKDSIESKKKVPESLIKEYASHYKLSIKDIHQALKFFPEGMELDILNFKKRQEVKKI